MSAAAEVTAMQVINPGARLLSSFGNDASTAGEAILCSYTRENTGLEQKEMVI